MLEMIPRETKERNQTSGIHHQVSGMKVNKTLKRIPSFVMNARNLSTSMQTFLNCQNSPSRKSNFKKAKAPLGGWDDSQKTSYDEEEDGDKALCVFMTYVDDPDCEDDQMCRRWR